MHFVTLRSLLQRFRYPWSDLPPWRVTERLSFPIDFKPIPSGARVRARVEPSRIAFYDTGRGQVDLLLRFVSFAFRNIDPPRRHVLFIAAIMHVSF